MNLNGVDCFSRSDRISIQQNRQNNQIRNRVLLNPSICICSVCIFVHAIARAFNSIKLLKTLLASPSSSAIISPLLNKGLSHFLLQLSCAILYQATSANFSILSFHLVSVFFLLSFSLYGCQSVRLFVHLLSFILATCCPPPFQLFHFLYHIFFFSFFSHPGRFFPVSQCYS